MRRPLLYLPDYKRALVIKNRLAAQKSYLRKKALAGLKPAKKALVSRAAIDENLPPFKAGDMIIPSFNSSD